MMTSALRRVMALTALSMASLALVSSDVSAQISFGQSNLDFGGLGGVSSGTSLKFGPDGRLYVLQINGTIQVLTVVRNGVNDYEVTAVETLTDVQDIPNHNDDGSSAGNSTREATGLTVAGTASNPVIYASSSDPRVGAGGGGGDVNLDTNSGVITRLTWNGASWDVVDLVRGLPRSEENHATNGLEYAVIGGNPYLIVSQGGLTNAGSPSNNFAYISEYALSAAVLSIDLTQINALPILNDGTRDYIYDVPTLDDPTRANANAIEDPNAPGYDGIDVNDPWGGNDGLNQGKVVLGGPVQIYSPGYRNTYDLVVTDGGALYVTDNGANGGWGGYPENEGLGGNATNTYRSGEPGSSGSDGGESGVNNQDHLTCVTTDMQTYVSGSFYGGHPCPTRSNPFASGLYTRGTHTTGGLFFSDDWFRTVPYDPNGVGEAADPTQALPADWPPVPPALADTVQGDFRLPGGVNPDGPDDVLVTTWQNNTNGIDEYTAGNFGGAMQGDLIAGKSGGNLHRVVVNPDGTLNLLEQNKFSGLGGNPLGIECVGPSDVGVDPTLVGTIWVATFNSNIVVLEPDDLVVCVLPGEPGYDPNGDNDNDGYTNDDEDQNGTDMCNGASQPSDFDGDLVSDLLDLDDDDDTVNDDVDAFQLGAPFDVPVVNELFSDQPALGGYLGLGLTGLMNNGDPNPNYQDWLDKPTASPNDIYGGAIGAMTVYQTEGDALFDDQEKGFQYGVNVSTATGPFTVSCGMLQPFHAHVGNESQGLFIGTGFQDDYIKFVLQDDQLSLGGEDGGTPLAGLPSGTLASTPLETLVLQLVIDPVANTLQARYAVDGGAFVDLGSPFASQGSVQTAIQSAGSPLAVGMIGTSRGQGDESFAANFDHLNVVGSAPFVVQALPDVNRTVGDPDDNVDLDTYFDDDAGTGNLTYTVETNTDPSVGASIVGNTLTLSYPGTPTTSDITVRATDTDLFFVEDTFTVTVSEAPVVLYRVNAGGPLVAAIDADIDWGLDTAASNSPYLVDPGSNGVYNGGAITGYDASVPATTPTGIFGQERYDASGGPEMQWSFPVGASADYIVRIYMGNRFAGTGTVGARVFDVAIEGAVPANLDDVDLVALFGHEIGGMIENTVTITDGAIDITMVHDVIENPLLNGIEILGPPGSGVGVLAAGPDPLDFGDQEETTTSAPLTVTLSNTGGIDVEIVSLSLTGADPTLFAVDSAPATPFMLSAGFPVDVDLTFTPDSPGAKTANLSIAHDGSNPSPLDVVLQGNGTTPGFIPDIRINAGGPEYTDGLTQTWEADNYFVGGTAFAKAGLPIDNTTDDTLYQTERYGNPVTYNIPVVNATYDVELHFAEIYLGSAQTPNNPGGGAGDRIFDVTLEGVTVLGNGVDQYDIYAEVGADAAVVKTFTTVVSDGSLDLVFTPTADNAKISAIAVLPSTALPTLEATPDPLDFADQIANTSSAPAALTLSAVVDSIDVTDITITGPDAAAFATDFTVPLTVVPGTPVDVNVTFTPDAVGPFSATAEITHDGDNSPLLVALTGDGVAPALAFAPASLSFTLAEGPNTDNDVSTVSANDAMTPTVNLSAIDDTTGLAPTWLGLTPSASVTAGNPVTVDVDATGLAPGTYTATVTGTSAGYDDGTLAVTLDVTPPPLLALFRVNAGGALVAAADASTPDWGSDTNGSPSPYRVAGGQNTYAASSGSAHPGPVIMTDPSIPASAPIDVFEIERWDPPAAPEMLWQFPIPPGTEVQVNLLFAELFGGVDLVGERVMDVSVEGVVPASFDDVDAIAIAGPKGAFARSHTLVVSDGTLDIEFLHVVENTALKGIEILEVTPAPVTLAGAPDPLTFADQIENTSSAPLALTLSATGGSIQVTDVTITGAGAGAFVSDFTVPFPVDPGTPVDVNVTFTPDAIAAFNATAEITHDGDNSPLLVGLTGNGIASPVPDNLIAAEVDPSACLSTANSCVAGTPITITRTDATNVRAVSVTFDLGAELDLCSGLASITEGTYLSDSNPGTATLMQTLDHGDGTFTVDLSILGVPCGATAASGTLFTIDVTHAGIEGTGTISILSVDVRDCDNVVLDAGPGAPASIPIDLTAPAAVTELASTVVTSGNPAGSTMGVDVSWPPTEAGSAFAVYAKGFGNYPEYDDAPGSGAVPTAPADPAAAISESWTLVDSTDTPFTDLQAGRDEWYYVGFVVDECGNVSGPSNLTGGDLNYLLGDFAPAGSDGDNTADFLDLSLIGSVYATSDGDTLYEPTVDIGPTEGGAVTGRPLTDDVINFEDLIILAINYDTVVTRYDATGEPGVVLSPSGSVTVGGTYSVTIHLSGGRDLRGVSLGLDWNSDVVRPTGFLPGDLGRQQPGELLVLSPAPGVVDAASFGAPIVGEGALGVVTFEVLAVGDPGIGIASLAARAGQNEALDLDVSVDADAVGVPAVTQLLPSAPNPFRSATSVGFDLANAGRALVQVFSVDGRLVRTLVDGTLPAGGYRLAWDGRDDAGRQVSSGIYLLRFVTPDVTTAGRIVRIR